MDQLTLFPMPPAEQPLTLLPGDKMFADMELEGGPSPTDPGEFERRMRNRTADEDRIQAATEYYGGRYPDVARRDDDSSYWDDDTDCDCR